jgi:hypothetical protein
MIAGMRNTGGMVMVKRASAWSLLLLVACGAEVAGPAAALRESVAGLHKAKINGNSIWLDGEPGRVIYRSSGDLNGDGHREMVCTAIFGDDPDGVLLVLEATRSGNRLMCVGQTFVGIPKADVTDINGDRKMEIVVRGWTADGHRRCVIYRLRGPRLAQIAQLDDTRFRDLNGDGVPEALSKGWVSFGFVGDHWLTIYKWNGQGYTDVSPRFPREYDAVIRDLKKTIHDLRYTKAHGHEFDPGSCPEMFGDLYYHLGWAYEYRGLPDKAKMQYAIAYRLNPDYDTTDAFRRTWKKHNP